MLSQLKKWWKDGGVFGVERKGGLFFWSRGHVRTLRETQHSTLYSTLEVGTETVTDELTRLT